ncbi:MAG: hypothetical protein WC246_04140 [Candidatus Paceibacterota bacterium]|jgi:hypothetical protein
MPELTKLTLTEFIYDVLWTFMTVIVVAILSIPLALAILAALALLLLPEAVGYLSWTHLILQLEPLKQVTPHTLFSLVKGLFVMAWGFAFFAKLLVLPDEQNIVIQQRRFREKRRNSRRIRSPEALSDVH